MLGNQTADLLALSTDVTGTDRESRRLRPPASTPRGPTRMVALALSFCIVEDECLVCRELRGDVPVPGGFLLRDEAVTAFHLPPLDERGSPYLGHLLIVTLRHVARLGDLSDDESAAVGRAAARLARALTEAGGAEWVYSAVIGIGVPHFHLHLIPRYPGTPRAVPWHEVNHWEGARRGGADEIAELVERLRARIG